MPLSLSFIEQTSFQEIDSQPYDLWHYRLSWTDTATLPSGPYVVQSGDTLWSIAAQLYKDPLRWTDIWRLNKGQIADPSIVFAGQELQLPTSLGLEAQVGLGFSAGIDIRDPSQFVGVT